MSANAYFEKSLFERERNADNQTSVNLKIKILNSFKVTGLCPVLIVRRPLKYFLRFTNLSS